ncbi:MAG: ferrochelatase [Vicinamibacteria bacterium]|nr:ferrochelatase [Vicinamibacteria bacterium]
MTRRHLVLVSYGEPQAPSFTEQFAYSHRILRNLTRIIAAIPAPLIPLIALSRAHGRRKLWRRWGYGSPLEGITREQARRIKATLDAAFPDGGWVSHVAYEFRRPFLGDVLRALPSDEPIWIAPMYAADSAFTHALSRQVADGINESGRRGRPVQVLSAIEAESLAELSAGHVLDCLGFDGDQGRSTALVLAAHGTLLEPAKPIDTGRENTERLCEAIKTRLAPSFGMVAHGWLNHTRGGRWTEPPVEQTLQGVSDAGYSKVAYFPYGFLADNAETQLEGRVIAARHPQMDVRFVPCLNATASLLDAIAAQVMSTLEATRPAALPSEGRLSTIPSRIRRLPAD